MVIDVEIVAQKYGADKRSIFRWADAGKIPRRRDVADELREWVSTMQTGRRDSEGVLTFRRSSVAAKLPASTRLFTIPKAFCKILNRDLNAAGIPKSDDRGRTIDVHALRHTFGTNLSKAGVAPKVAQSAMRHSSINLTMNVDTDPRLLDVQAVVESLPSMSVTAEPNDNRQRIAAGAENLVAPNADFSGDSQSTAVTLLAISSAETFANSANAKAVATNEKTLAVTK